LVFGSVFGIIFGLKIGYFFWTRFTGTTNMDGKIGRAIGATEKLDGKIGRDLGPRKNWTKKIGRNCRLLGTDFQTFLVIQFVILPSISEDWQPQWASQPGVSCISRKIGCLGHANVAAGYVGAHAGQAREPIAAANIRIVSVLVLVLV